MKSFRRITLPTSNRKTGPRRKGYFREPRSAGLDCCSESCWALPPSFVTCAEPRASGRFQPSNQRTSMFTEVDPFRDTLTWINPRVPRHQDKEGKVDYD